MEKNLIIHGHFYQPPRENPYIDSILKQDSAAPYHDWNERITAECYKPNASSRILDGFGRIKRIINNYEYLSFNFGPTLMDYLAKFYPETVELIAEADRKSAEKHNGHGNAIAQVYNHIILPLASYEDKLVQIKWGIYNFKKYFGRHPEGMWLSETAINTETVQALYECGIRFTVLSPYQAALVRNNRADEGQVVSGGQIDTSRPYILKGSSGGAIAAFFYDGPISQSIAFEHLLTHADKLTEKIDSQFGHGKKMLNLATDGESYGHHEPFGDMCLAAFFADAAQKKGIYVTNYGEFLEKNPPVQEVVLEGGTDNRGTSWSCFHGVERWRSDCGCQTGGHEDWNQKWRGPLRDAMDCVRNLQDKAAHTYLNLSAEKLQHLREEYITAVYNEGQAQRLFDEYLTDGQGLDLNGFVTLMEAYKFSLYSYTSCGWFFADISGIEPVHNMRYADIALSYLEELSANADYVKEARKSFMKHLEKAQSNIPERENGAKCFEDFVVGGIYSKEHIVNHAICEIVSTDGRLSKVKEYPIYNYSISIEQSDGNYSKGVLHTPLLGKKDFVSKTLQKKYDIVNKINLDGVERKKYIKAKAEEGKEFSLKDVIYERREAIVERMLNADIKGLHNSVAVAFKRAKKIIDVISSKNVKLKPEMRDFFSTFFTMHMEHTIKGKQDYFPGKYKELEQLIEIANREGIDVNTKKLNEELVSSLENRLKGLLETLKNNELKAAADTMAFADELKLDIPRHNLENEAYRIYHKYNNTELKTEERENLEKLAEWFNINTGG